MAMLSYCSLHRFCPLCSSSSPSSTSGIQFSFCRIATQYLCQHNPTRSEIPTSLAVSKVNYIQPKLLKFQPVLLFSGFDRPVDTQTFLVTISVLIAITLSLFLGLKVTSLPKLKNKEKKLAWTCYVLLHDPRWYPSPDFAAFIEETI